MPDIVFIDGNYDPPKNGHFITPQLLLDFKQKYSPFMKIVTIIPDSYQNIIAKKWEKCSDLIVCFPNNYSNLDLPNIFKWPTLPFHPTFFDQSQYSERKHNFTYIGSHGRNRPLFIKEIITKKNLNLLLKIHTGNPILELQNVYKTLSQSIVTLNSGWKGIASPHNRYIMTGRIGEAILSKTILAEEKNELIENYFTPYRHYIPIRTANDLLLTVKLFSKDEQCYEMISQQAYNHYLNNYSSTVFWKTLIKTLYP